MNYFLSLNTGIQMAKWEGIFSCLLSRKALWILHLTFRMTIRMQIINLNCNARQGKNKLALQCEEGKTHMDRTRSPNDIHLPIRMSTLVPAFTVSFPWYLLLHDLSCLPHPLQGEHQISFTVSSHLTFLSFVACTLSTTDLWLSVPSSASGLDTSWHSSSLSGHLQNTCPWRARRYLRGGGMREWMLLLVGTEASEHSALGILSVKKCSRTSVLFCLHQKNVSGKHLISQGEKHHPTAALPGWSQPRVMRSCCC